MLRLIHTADWQIGRVFAQFEEDDAEALAAERFAVIARIAALAAARQVDAVLVAGDVFDAQGVRDKTIHRMFMAMSGFTGPWVLLPGNHDAALSASVWTRAQHLGAVPPNVQLALSPAPVTVGQSCVILPAPLTQRHTYNDLTAWFDLADTPPDLPRIGLAHGSVQGILADGIDATNPIAADRVQTARLDYLALGDWHGMREIGPRCWYAGTPEPDRFRDNEAGHALYVEIDAPGATPRVQALSTGRYRWRTLAADLQGTSDVALVLEALAALGSDDVVQLRWSGMVDLHAHASLMQALQVSRARARAVLLDDEALRLAPTDEDLAALQADGYVGDVLEILRAEQHSEQPAVAGQARAALLVLAGLLSAAPAPNSVDAS